jgi:hypothetical protein
LKEVVEDGPGLPEAFDDLSRTIATSSVACAMLHELITKDETGMAEELWVANLSAIAKHRSGNGGQRYSPALLRNMLRIYVRCPGLVKVVQADGMLAMASKSCLEDYLWAWKPDTGFTPKA